MDNSSIIIIGCGGHAKSVIDLLKTNGQFIIKGLIGKKNELGKEVLGYKVIGTNDDLEQIRDKVSNAVIGIGQIKKVDLRENILQLLKKFNYETPKIISKFSYVSNFSSIGEGTCIGHHAIVNAGAKIGKFCILNSKCLVEHDSLVGDFCHLSTGVLINGDVNIGEKSFIGSGAIVREGIKLPSSSIIGAGKRVMAWPMMSDVN